MRLLEVLNLLLFCMKDSLPIFAIQYDTWIALNGISSLRFESIIYFYCWGFKESKHNFPSNTWSSNISKTSKNVKIVNLESTEVNLSWREDDYEGVSAFIGCTIENYCSTMHLDGAAQWISSETHTGNNLKQDSSYIFIVRAESSHGISEPSTISHLVKTLASKHLNNNINV